RAGFAGPLFFSTLSWTRAKAKIIFAVDGTRGWERVIMAMPGGGITNMRIFASMVACCLLAVPCSAQTILKSEPLVLAPYEVAFVRDFSCPTGKVMKVTGAIRGLHRRKACVVLPGEQASLATAIP